MRRLLSFLAALVIISGGLGLYTAGGEPQASPSPAYEAVQESQIASDCEQAAAMRQQTPGLQMTEC